MSETNGGSSGLTAPQALKFLRLIWGMERKVGNHDLTQPERSILTVLLLRCGRDGRIWPIGLTRLAEFAGLSRSKTHEVINDLMTAGIIERIDSGKRGKRAQYRIHTNPIVDNATDGEPITRQARRTRRKSVRSGADTLDTKSVRSGADTSAASNSGENRPARTLPSANARTLVSGLGRTRSDDVYDEVHDDVECKTLLGSPIGSPRESDSFSFDAKTETENGASGETESERRERFLRMARAAVEEQESRRWTLTSKRKWTDCTIYIDGDSYGPYRFNTVDPDEAEAKAQTQYDHIVANLRGTP